MGPNELEPSYRTTKTNPSLQNTESGGTMVKLFALILSVLLTGPSSSWVLNICICLLPESIQNNTAKKRRQRCSEKKSYTQHTKRTSFHIPSNTLFTAILLFDGIQSDLLTILLQNSHTDNDNSSLCSNKNKNKYLI
jgi:hypothetical protein